MAKLRIILFLIILFGCAQPRFTTKADTLTIVPPILEKNLTAKVVTDTLIMTNEVIRKDTITLIKYFPQEKKFYLKAKPDTIKIITIDTLMTEKSIEKTKTDYKLLLIAFLLGIAFTLIWRKS
ncbi:MAG: hypothetical protein N3A61_05155 [Ignavibacteria bacterium]|nr:hypothetical protein [Ignavibacteria bacterium]